MMERIKVKFLTVVIAAAILTGGYFISPGVSQAGNVDYGRHWGVNFTSKNWEYDTPNNTLDYFFSLFNTNNIDLITIMIHWSKIEPTKGNYDNTFLSNIVRVCQRADLYGIDVILDFQTLCDLDSFTIPAWVSPRMFATVLLDPIVRQAWLDMQEYTITYLSKVPNIHSWHIMNEPLIEGYGETEDQYVALWVDMVTVFHAHTSKPLSLRFGAWSFNEYWGTHTEVFTLFDYLAINWYPNKGVACLNASIAVIESHAKTVMISEYGLGNWDDITQETSVENQISIFKANGIKLALVWQMGDYEGGKGYNLFRTSTSEARPAFYDVGQANLTGETGGTPTRPRCDVNQDGVVDLKDVAYVVKQFNTWTGSPNWNSKADMNNDGTVNLRDVQIVVYNFRK